MDAACKMCCIGGSFAYPAGVFQSPTLASVDRAGVVGLSSSSSSSHCRPPQVATFGSIGAGVIARPTVPRTMPVVAFLFCLHSAKKHALGMTGVLSHPSSTTAP